MNQTSSQAVDLARRIREGGDGIVEREGVLFPSFPVLVLVGEVLRGSHIGLGAQNMHWEAGGAFTGEVSPMQVKDAGCGHVILGHSERRRCFGETDELVRRKVKSALQAQLIPVVCIGETLEERETQKTFRVLERQVQAALQGLAPVDFNRLVAAYEPVWAIGTGKTATPLQAQEANQFIRSLVSRLYGKEAASVLRILYGGSVRLDNIDPLMAQEDVDGALVGGESLKADAFIRVVRFQSQVAAGRGERDGRLGTADHGKN